LRASLRLRGTLISLDATESAFSPNGDEMMDATILNGEIHADAEDPSWAL
jgi:hypothetical protein